jgi:butanol dehydrogenase
MTFDYYNPVRLLFGPGQFNRLPQCLVAGESHALLVTGKGSAREHGHLDRAVLMLHDAGVQVTVYDEIPPNPTDDVIDTGGALAREESCDLVIGLGGGSAMDAAKAIAVAASHHFPIAEFLRPDGRGATRVPTERTLPTICITTTSGTSSELTPYAVVTVTDGREKRPLVSPRIFPRVGIVDPELTYSVPAYATASTGVDVLCHALEHPVSAHYPLVAHGAGLAALLVAYAKCGWEAMPEKFARVSALLGGPADGRAAAAQFEALLDTVDMNVNLSHLGVEREMLERLADDAIRYMSGGIAKTPGCPDRDCLISILNESY